MTTIDKILLVVGMHRSGTSFLAHCAEVLGYSLPQDRGGPASDNPKGHFEPQAIVALNDRVLARQGAWWGRIGAIATGPDTADMKAALADSFGDASGIVLKDPRLTMLLPAWRGFLQDNAKSVAALIALRHPAEAAASLARRDGMGADMAQLSWIAHTLAAIEGTDGLARTLVLFPDWTSEIDATLTRIAALNGDTVPPGAAAEVAARFDAQAVHGGRQLKAESAKIDALSNDLFALLCVHARAGTMPQAEPLAEFRTRFDAVSAPFRAVEAASDRHNQGREQVVSTLTDRVSQLATESAQFQADGVLLQTLLAEAKAERETAVLAARAEAREYSDALQTQLDASEAQRLADVAMLERERLTILKPLYRRTHRFGGRVLRRVLPDAAFDRVKRLVPRPGGVPGRLTYHTSRAPSGHTESFAEIAPGDPERPDIFVMSIINWDFRTQRPQHLAREFARAGHRVFYIEMEGDHGPGQSREVAPNVHVIRLSARGMAGVKAYSGTIDGQSQRVWVDHFYHLADVTGCSPRAHVVVEHPYWWTFVRHLSSQFQITFDCMDEISGFSNTEKAILDAEHEMIEKADRMIVSSQYLHDKYAPLRNVALVRNGTDVSHFTADDAANGLPDFLRGKLAEGAIRVGYVGAIAEWFDVDMLERVALDNPDFDIHLCGSVTAAAPVRLEALANVTLYGEIDYADVPGFLRAMDVLIIPFQLLPIIKACDPVKFYEYAAVRKPVVASAMPELARAGDLVITADDAEGFAAGIRAASQKTEDPAHGDALRQYALDNAWSFRARDMLAEMEHAALLSVVVLAYGAADLTLTCLESLLGRGEVYPALEVIVVDNGSTEAELSRLRASAQADPRIKLIENGENLGFARGNNVGIAAASGEYVLLLNNDTYVPPGALSAMVRHLERRPDIGIIGPLTNNIGNEARIELAYRDMAEMEWMARDLVTGYRLVATEIPVCAYFCAMMRKSDLDRLGHLPTIYGRGMFEDDDHCATFRAAGLLTALAEDAFVHHDLSATFGQLPSQEKSDLFNANKSTFQARWGEWVPHRYRETRPPASLPDRS